MLELFISAVILVTRVRREKQNGTRDYTEKGGSVAPVPRHRG
jgi:hypothetical protein